MVAYEVMYNTQGRPGSRGGNVQPSSFLSLFPLFLSVFVIVISLLLLHVHVKENEQVLWVLTS